MNVTMRRILLTFLWLVILGLIVWKEQYGNFFIWGVGLIVTLLWTIDIESIKKVSYDLQHKKFEINTMYEETKKIGNEVELTAHTFVNAINSFINFTFSDIQRQGRLASTVSWQSAAKFVEESMDLKRVLKDTDPETGILIMKAKCKVLELFQFNASRFFEEQQKPDFFKLISSGITIGHDELLYNPDSVAVDIEGLKNLSYQVLEGKEALWMEEIGMLEKFYERNFRSR